MQGVFFFILEEKKISLLIKIKILQVKVMTVAKHGSETETPHKAEEDPLNVFKGSYRKTVIKFVIIVTSSTDRS